MHNRFEFVLEFLEPRRMLSSTSSGDGPDVTYTDDNPMSGIIGMRGGHLEGPVGWAAGLRGDAAPKVVIDWGDGTQSPAELTPQPFEFESYQGYYVHGSHDYSSAGQYEVTVITDYGGEYGPMAEWYFEVLPFAPTLTPLSPDYDHAVMAPYDKEFYDGISLGSFYDVDHLNNPEDYALTIDWGDGNQSNQSFEKDDVYNDLYSIYGHHTYAQPGTYEITYTATRNDGVTLSHTTTYELQDWDSYIAENPLLGVVVSWDGLGGSRSDVLDISPGKTSVTSDQATAHPAPAQPANHGAASHPAVATIASKIFGDNKMKELDSSADDPLVV